MQRKKIQKELAAYIADLEEDWRTGFFLDSDRSTFFRTFCMDHLWALAYSRYGVGAPHVLKFAEALNACEEYDQLRKNGEKFEYSVRLVAQEYGPKPRTMAALISERRFCRELEERPLASFGIGPMFWESE